MIDAACVDVLGDFIGEIDTAPGGPGETGQKLVGGSPKSAC